MPEFHLDTEGAPPAWEALDDFARGFIEAAFFTSTSCFPACEFFTPEAQESVSEGTADGDIPSDAGVSDLDAAAFERVAAWCADFQARAAELLAEAYGRDYDASQAGRDFYFTAAGHGVGYWDRKPLAIDESGDYERLTEAMRAAAACGDNAAWDSACSERGRIKTLGDKLSDACGRREINLYAYEAADSESGFRVGLDG